MSLRSRPPPPGTGDDASPLESALLAAKLQPPETLGIDPDDGLVMTGLAPSAWFIDPEQVRDSLQRGVILDSLPARIALLNAGGIVVSVNAAWQRFIDSSGLAEPGFGIGKDYLQILPVQHGADAASQRRAAAGIEAVLAGRSTQFELEYPCADVQQPRWFLMRVVPLADDPLHGAVVMHVDISEHKRLEQRLLESQRRLDCIVTSAMDAIVDIDERGLITHANPTAERMFGYAAAELLGQPLDLLLPERFRSAHGRHIDSFAASPVRSQRMAVQSACGLRKNGLEFPIEVSISKDEATGQRHFTAIVRDISERVRSDEQIRRLNRVHAMLTDINSLIVRVRDRDELFAEACRIAVDEGGFEQAMIVGLSEDGLRLLPLAARVHAARTPNVLHSVLTDPSGRPSFASLQAIRERRAIVLRQPENPMSSALAAEPAQAEASVVAVLPLVLADRVVGLLALHTCELEYFHDQEIGLLSKLADDIAFAMDYLDKRDRLDYLAYYDVLTGLANRSLFLERVAQFMRGAAAEGQGLALYLIDIERFKTINDSLGRGAGDALLKQVGAWLTRKAEDSSLVARVGADHFAVVLPEVSAAVDLARRIESVLEAFVEHPFRLDGGVFRVVAKAGIAMFPDDGDSAETLFRNAEAALKRAKAHGDRYLFYTRSMTESVAGRLTLESELRVALQQHAFVLHYQPKRRLVDGRIVGAEALIRWRDPRRGLVMPTEFVPVLEETGLIHEVGRWALQQAVRDHQRWREHGLRAVRIAVNVSPLQLRHRDFISDIRQVLATAPGSAAGLKLEITEGLIMEDVRHSIASLAAIRAMGVTVAIDDFGTGYSSLSYLARLPVDSLKIDRSFIEGLSPGTAAAALVATIVNLGHSLKLRVVAEGVETDAQAELLRALGCEEIQGFLVSEPLPAEEFERLFLSGDPRR